jgi:hypothetical protein
MEGLLRAVLHALLSGLSQSGVSENLEVIQHVCESRWQSTDKGRAWSSKELKEMLSRLAQTSNAKVFLLIDALDECDPQDRLGDLADMIIWLSRLSNVKLCDSCRPWAPFTRRFDKATVLHLDQLTYHDMEVYIETRLLCAENEADLCTDFHDGTLPAKRLINDVADAANGVFLWVELVLNALCSEIRTGCSIEQLRSAISEFPTGLDDYFQKLIFGRIGTTRPNVPKTAAALKLAMVLQSYEVGLYQGSRRTMPMSDDYLNFWLLSIGQLDSGFSWTDQLDSRCSAFDTESKLRHTKAFLEETCKDLLVMQKGGRSYSVRFLHRTVLDFLCDNAASLPIEKHAPSHFSDEGFTMDLLKLRCICQLRETGMDCELSLLLLDVILRFLNGTALEIQRQWLLACESTVLDSLRTRCKCLGLEHLVNRIFVKDCVSSGLHRILLEPAKDMPHVAIFQNYLHKQDCLELALLELSKPGTRKATATGLLRQALWCGCDPNASFGRDGPEKSCRQSKWERWLNAEYLYSRQHSRVTRAHQSTGATKDIDCQRIQENATIIELLLRHGANPNCTPCTTDHQSARDCFPTALHDILQLIVPAECVASLQALLVACSSDDRRYALRRNQRKRAIRSYVISEQRFASRVTDRCPQELPANRRGDWAGFHRQSWRLHQRGFLQGLMMPGHDEAEQKTCSESHESRTYPGLLMCCLDCESRSYACLSHSHSPSLAMDAPCTNLPNLRIAKPQGHTTVAILVDIDSGDDARRRWPSAYEDSARLSAAYQYLGCEPGELDLTDQAAISVLKEWNARNPIEPDSLQGDDFQDVALPQELDVAALTIGGPNIYETSIAE